MSETATKKKSGQKKPGTCTVQSLEIVSPTLSGMVQSLDASTRYVIAAAIVAFNELDTARQIELIQQARVACATSLNG